MKTGPQRYNTEPAILAAMDAVQHRIKLKLLAADVVEAEIRRVRAESNAKWSEYILDLRQQHDKLLAQVARLNKRSMKRLSTKLAEFRTMILPGIVADGSVPVRFRLKPKDPGARAGSQKASMEAATKAAPANPTEPSGASPL
jgi:hypothetical protein